MAAKEIAYVHQERKEKKATREKWIDNTHTNVSVPHHCHSNMRYKFSVLVWITFHITSHSLFSLLCERDRPLSNSSVQNSKICPMSLLASDPVQLT